VRFAGFLVFALAGCELYFAPDPAENVDARRVDAPIGGVDASISDWCARHAFCGGDGVQYIAPPIDPSYCPSDDVFVRGQPVGRCAGACAIDSAAEPCATPSCATELSRVCGPPPTCPETGQLCTGSVRCTETTRCGRSALRATCTCDASGRYACTDNTAATRAAMLGAWRGTVYPPSFAQPYEVQLTFLPDGTYWAEAEGPIRAAFYYGAAGGGPGRRWEVLGDSEGGPLVRLDVYFGVYSIRTSVLTGVEPRGDTLRFTFWDAWLDCSRPFTFDLRRM
jgi:hypothetical protein